MAVKTTKRILKRLQAQNVTKDVGCSHSAVSTIWIKYQQNGKIAKRKHIGLPKKTSKPQDRKLKEICLKISKCTTKRVNRKWSQRDRTWNYCLIEMDKHIEKSNESHHQHPKTYGWNCLPEKNLYISSHWRFRPVCEVKVQGRCYILHNL